MKPNSEYKNTIGVEWTENFLRYLREKNVELDFFSWHYYGLESARFHRDE